MMANQEYKRKERPKSGKGSSVESHKKQSSSKPRKKSSKDKHRKSSSRERDKSSRESSVQDLSDESKKERTSYKRRSLPIFGRKKSLDKLIRYSEEKSRSPRKISLLSITKKKEKSPRSEHTKESSDARESSLEDRGRKKRRKTSSMEAVPDKSYKEHKQGRRILPIDHEKSSTRHSKSSPAGSSQSANEHIESHRGSLPISRNESTTNKSLSTGRTKSLTESMDSRIKDRRRSSRDRKKSSPKSRFQFGGRRSKHKKSRSIDSRKSSQKRSSSDSSKSSTEHIDSRKSPTEHLIRGRSKLRSMFTGHRKSSTKRRKRSSIGSSDHSSIGSKKYLQRASTIDSLKNSPKRSRHGKHRKKSSYEPIDDSERTSQDEKISPKKIPRGEKSRQSSRGSSPRGKKKRRPSSSKHKKGSEQFFTDSTLDSKSPIIFRLTPPSVRKSKKSSSESLRNSDNEEHNRTSINADSEECKQPIKENFEEYKAPFKAEGFPAISQKDDAESDSEKKNFERVKKLPTAEDIRMEFLKKLMRYRVRKGSLTEHSVSKKISPQYGRSIRANVSLSSLQTTSKEYKKEQGNFEKMRQAHAPHKKYDPGKSWYELITGDCDQSGTNSLKHYSQRESEHTTKGSTNQSSTNKDKINSTFKKFDYCTSESDNIISSKSAHRKAPNDSKTHTPINRTEQGDSERMFPIHTPDEDQKTEERWYEFKTNNHNVSHFTPSILYNFLRRVSEHSAEQSVTEKSNSKDSKDRISKQISGSMLNSKGSREQGMASETGTSINRTGLGHSEVFPAHTQPEKSWYELTTGSETVSHCPPSIYHFSRHVPEHSAEQSATESSTSIYKEHWKDMLRRASASRKTRTSADQGYPVHTSYEEDKSEKSWYELTKGNENISHCSPNIYHCLQRVPEHSAEQSETESSTNISKQLSLSLGSREHSMCKKDMPRRQSSASDVSRNYNHRRDSNASETYKTSAHRRACASSKKRMPVHTPCEEYEPGKGWYELITGNKNVDRHSQSYQDKIRRSLLKPYSRSLSEHSARRSVTERDKQYSLFSMPHSKGRRERELSNNYIPRRHSSSSDAHMKFYRHNESLNNSKGSEESKTRTRHIRSLFPESMNAGKMSGSGLYSQSFSEGSREIGHNSSSKKSEEKGKIKDYMISLSDVRKRTKGTVKIFTRRKNGEEIETTGSSRKRSSLKSPHCSFKKHSEEYLNKFNGSLEESGSEDIETKQNSSKSSSLKRHSEEYWNEFRIGNGSVKASHRNSDEEIGIKGSSNKCSSMKSLHCTFKKHSEEEFKIANEESGRKDGETTGSSRKRSSLKSPHCTFKEHSEEDLNEFRIANEASGRKDGEEIEIQGSTGKRTSLKSPQKPSEELAGNECGKGSHLEPRRYKPKHTKQKDSKISETGLGFCEQGEQDSPECKKAPRLSNESGSSITGSTSASHTVASTATCDICFEAHPSVYCNRNMCMNCVLSHKRLQKLFPGHRLDSIYMETKSAALAKSVERQICTEHAQQMNMYCYDCKQLICLYCSMKDHKSHSHVFIEVAAPEVKKSLIEQLAPLREMRKDLTKASDNIKSAKKEIEDKKVTMVEHIEETFDELHKMLEQQEVKIIGDAKMNVVNKLKVLNSQEQSLFSADLLIKSIIMGTEKCVEVSGDADIMMMHTDIQQHIDREIEKQLLWRNWQNESQASREHSEHEATNREPPEHEATKREPYEYEHETTSSWLEEKIETEIQHPDEFYRPRKCSQSKKRD